MIDCRTDKRFSPEEIQISAFGENDTISEIYRKARRDASGNICPTNTEPDHITIGGKNFALEQAGIFYESLWLCHLQHHPDLVEEIRVCGKVEDGHEALAYNSPARVFRIIATGGIKALNDRCREFVLTVNKKQETPFDSLLKAGFKIAKACFNEEKGLDGVDFSEHAPNEVLVKKIAEVYLSNLRKEITEEYGSGMIKKLEQKYICS